MTSYADIDSYPFTTVAYVTARFGDKWMSGSGVLVGRNDILTASHVIHDNLHGLADEIFVYLAYDPDNKPVRYQGAHFQYFDNYDPDGDGRLYAGDGNASTLGGAEVDIALITLTSAPGDVHGWMDINFSYVNGYANLTGHPGAYSKYMVNDYAWAERNYRDHFIDISDFEVNPGNSGGPIWIEGINGPEVVGLVSTKSAGVSLSGHQWLTDAVAANDRYLLVTTHDTRGTKGDDVFVAQASSSTFQGGLGLDSIVYNGSRDDFSIKAGSDVVVVRPDGKTDTLVSIERAMFEDGVLLFGMQGQEAEQTYRMYAAAYGRTPDEEGLIFWVDVMERLASDRSAGDPLQYLAESFLNADEYQGLYGSNPTNVEYVDAMYRNVLLRKPDDEGYDYWVGRMEDGVGRDEILIAFSESIENKINTAPNLSEGAWVV